MAMATESERIARIEGAYEHLATRADVETVKVSVQTVKSELQREIQTVKSELQTEIQEVRTELKAEIQDVRTEIQDVKSTLAAMRNEQRWTRWFLAIIAAGVLIPLLQNLFGQLP